jgi:hypothetical protein
VELLIAPIAMKITVKPHPTSPKGRRKKPCSCAVIAMNSGISYYSKKSFAYNFIPLTLYSF